MKKLLFFTFLFFSSYSGYSQAYIPMPVDSAIWRYRFYDIDFVTKVFDCILFVNGTDTAANGKTYHKIFSRSRLITVPNDSIPPITTVTATYGDTYYGAMRDSGQQVFLLTLSGEELMFDFNAGVGDSIPTYSGKVAVVAIDSILLPGTYHRRFLTTDSTYFAIEGIGSNRGLIPQINEDDGTVQFFCYTDTPAVYAPDSTIACTYVYPAWYNPTLNIKTIDEPDITISPVPAYDVLHFATPANGQLQVVVYNNIGQVIWRGYFLHQLDITVAPWPKGMYYVQVTGNGIPAVMKKIVVE